MTAAIAQVLAIVLGLWLAGLGLMMALAPRRSLRALAAMGGSPAIHYGEMILRIAAGVVLIAAAGVSRHPAVLTTVGGFLIVSAAVLLLLPRRWHAGYSTWWARRIPTAAVRAIGPVSIAMGALLIWTILPVRAT